MASSSIRQKIDAISVISHARHAVEMDHRTAVLASLETRWMPIFFHAITQVFKKNLLNFQIDY